MITIGTVMGDRYEVLEKIGTGGMSDVYKAKDNKLNRYVAIKVLKSEFSENTNFVSKFRVEAQAAARLTHPNIVNVYDVGEEGDTHYIVMELVEGITLKNYIEKKARLSVKEAISIAIQVSMGIEAAHNNHIIHRDIKPQNIMISKEGKVKIADFGIAKAATSNTITSNVMGSVHYTSPEQARGGFSDERSDIYSLGCTMYEMLTGRVPFDGETTVAIAIRHIQEEMPSPRDFVSEIPVCVEQIIFKCTQKSPDRRYQSMSELIVDLKKSLITPNENFVKIIDADTGGATKTISEEDLEQIKRQTGNIYLGKVLPSDQTGVVNAGEEDYADVTEQTDEGWDEEGYEDEGYEEGYEDEEYEEGYEDEEYEEGYEEGYDEEYEEGYEDGYEEGYEDEYEEGYEDEYEEGYEDEYEDRRAVKRRDAAALKQSRQKEKEAAEKRRKAQKEKEKEAARKAAAKKAKAQKEKQERAKADKAKAEKERRNERDQRTREMAKKNAADARRRSADDAEYEDAEDRMEKITTVLAIVAAVIIGILALVIVGNIMGVFKKKDKTPDTEQTDLLLEDEDAQAEEDPQDSLLKENSVVMINVVGKKLDEAKKALQEIALGTKVTEQESADYEEGTVISQDIAEGATIAKNSTINLVVSTGGKKAEEGVVVVDVSGKGESEAKSALEALGFVVEVSTENSDSVEEGKVISQSPAAGESVEKGGKITLTVSAGPKTEKVTVPDLRGMTETTAKEKLAAEGLKCGSVKEEHSDTVTAGCVMSQSNDPGSKVDKGSGINIVLSVGPKKHTYKYSDNISAPTGYTGGTATVTITAADGTTRSFDTTQFPVAVNETGFTSATGTVTITYKSQVEETVIDPNTGEQSIQMTEGNVTSGPTAVSFTEE